jgi:hypothetical protein
MCGSLLLMRTGVGLPDPGDAPRLRQPEAWDLHQMREEVRWYRSRIIVSQMFWRQYAVDSRKTVVTKMSSDYSGLSCMD